MLTKIGTEEIKPPIPEDLDTPNIDLKEAKIMVENEGDWDITEKPTLSLNDIMNADLTGADPSLKKKSRTEDDLPGGPKKSKDEKADILTEELMFYLMMEWRSNFFPQRVNPEKLKIKTKNEIDEFEKRKAEESWKDKSEIKTVEELKEENEEEFLENKMAIKTDRNSIKEYSHTLLSKICERKEDFITNLSSPLQRNPLEILMHLQSTFYELEENEQLPYQQSVLPVDIYLDIERERRKIEEEKLEINKAEAREIYENKKKIKKQQEREKVKEIDQEKEEKHSDVQGKNTNSWSPENKTLLNSENEKERECEEEKNEDWESESKSSFTKDEELDNKLFNLKCEWENIHNKAIFDAVNEALDGLRPYGLKGPPLPWSKQSRALTYKNGEPTEIPKIKTRIENKIIGWIGDQNPNEPSPDAWEKRLAVILANEIEESEPLWTDYEFEETHVKIDIADVILDELYNETVQIMQYRKVLPTVPPQVIKDGNINTKTDLEENEKVDKIESATMFE